MPSLAALTILSGSSAAPVQPPAPSVPPSAAHAQGGAAPDAGPALGSARWAGYGDARLTALADEASPPITTWPSRGDASTPEEMGELLADAEALRVARLERVSLDDISRQAQPTRIHPQHGAHHHG